MKEYVELRVSPLIKNFLDKSIMSIAKCEGSLSVVVTCIFELPSDDQRWKNILNACDMLEQYEKQAEPLREFVSPSYFKEIKEIAQLVNEKAVSRGWALRPRHGYTNITVKRYYANSELRSAEILQMIPHVITQFERQKDDNEQIYDLDSRCRMCGIVKQKSELIFKSLKLPKAKDIVSPLGLNEMLISEKLVELFIENRVAGYTLRDVFQRKRSNLVKVAGWKQLVINSEVSISGKTSFGYDFFHLDESGKEGCRVCGKTRGIGIQTPLFIKRETWAGSDIAATSDYIGGNTTLGFPLQMTIISQKLFRLFLENKIIGYHMEVANLV